MDVSIAILGPLTSRRIGHRSRLLHTVWTQWCPESHLWNIYHALSSMSCSDIFSSAVYRKLLCNRINTPNPLFFRWWFILNQSDRVSRISFTCLRVIVHLISPQGFIFLNAFLFSFGRMILYHFNIVYDTTIGRFPVKQKGGSLCVGSLD